MKKLLFIFALLIVQTEFYGQSLPNGGFEEWTTRSFDEADGWITSNPGTVSYGDVITVTKVAGNTGFGYRMESKLFDDRILSGYLLNTNGDIFVGEGGWPYSQQPSSITGYYRYNLPANDTALLIVVFKAAGSVICTDIFKIKGTGSQPTFIPFSFPLTLSSMPDSVIFASASSNLLADQGKEPGSFLELDGLAFSGAGITQAIPNGQFENWSSNSIEKLDNWYSDVTGVEKTTDAYAGNFALRLQTIPQYIGGTLYNLPSLASSRIDGVNGGLPFTSMVDTLCGYYKYIVPGGAMDSAWVSVNLTNNTSVVGTEEKYLYPTANYTYFEIPINAVSTPDSISVDVLSSAFINNFAVAGSTLYIDKFLLKSNPYAGVNEMVRNRKNYSFPNPANEILNIYFDGTLSGVLTLSVYDVTGKLLKKEKYSNASGSVQIKTDELFSGVYLYELTNGKETIRNKFIKK